MGPAQNSRSNLTKPERNGGEIVGTETPKTAVLPGRAEGEVLAKGKGKAPFFKVYLSFCSRQKCC